MKRIPILVLLLLTAFVGSQAQETHATLTGRITDSSGAVVPNAQITITDTDTGVVTKSASNAAGVYTSPFLTAGHYQIAVNAPGFKAYVHSGLALATDQIVTENVALAVGAASQTVTVSSSTPLISTADASTGQVLSGDAAAVLPSNGRAPLGFAHLEYGAVAKGKHSQSQVTPFANSTADDFSLGGGNSSSNELLLNGVPNMQDSGRTAGYSPELDAVDSIRVDEFDTSAVTGDTSGGTVDITTKHGTNQFHGSGSEYYAGSRPLQALPYFDAPGTKVTSTHFNQFAGVIGGPVVLPHIYNGHNKLFFFYAFEGYIGSSPATTITSVPTQAERTGDFSALLSQGTNVTDTRCAGYTVTHNSFQLYDPNSGVADPNCPGLVERTPLTDNKIGSVSPIAQKYLALIPMPNYMGPSTTADGENNYFASDPTINNYKSNQGEIDYNASQSNKISFEAHRSDYVVSQSNIFSNALSGTTSNLILWGGQADDVETFSPSLSLETRLGFSRYDTTSNPNSAGIDPTTFGFPGYISSNSTSLAIPYLTFSDSAPVPSLSGAPGSSEKYDMIQLYSILSKIIGNHSLKAGADIRANKDSVLSPGDANGDFPFNSGNGDFVTAGSNGSKQPFGGAFALFEEGLPTGGSYAINTPFQYDNWYTGFFVQDDWKAMPNLTISMGLRLEHETPVVESNNRMVSGWDPTTVNAVTAAAATNYAANPLPNNLLPVANFAATGGIVYASSSSRSAYHPGPLYVSPRLGIAYSPGFSHGTMAIRLGFGIYNNPFNNYDHGQSYGFSQSTSLVTTNNNGLTSASSLSDPFPASGVNGNPIQLPTGSGLGINTNLGSSIVYYAPVKVAYAQKWSLDVQKQFQRNWLLEAGYIGVHQVHQSYSNDISAIPMLPLLSHTAEINPTLTAELNASVPNPIYKTFPSTLPTAGLNTSKTVSVATVLNAYPEYSGITEQLVPGASANFNALLVRVYKQLSNGLQFDMNYQYSRNLGASSQLNSGGPLWYGVSSSDFPNHFSLTAIYQLPFGKGRTWMNNSQLADELIGGWQVSGIYQFLSGTPISWGNVIYNGNWHDFNNHPHKTNGPSFNTANFVTTSSLQPNSYNYRTFPAMLLRSDPTNNFDFSIMKNFTIWDRLVLQPRVDAFNAFNHPQFSSANVSPTSSSFSDVSGQLNTGRQLQGGIHILF